MVKKNFWVLLLGQLSIACSIVGVRSEEVPEFQVIKEEGDKQIRKYKSYIVAKATVQGTSDESSTKAFRILAGYIFGKNQKKQQISMTAPVVLDKQKPNAEYGNMQIEMTAPVLQEKRADTTTMSFSMPGKFKVEDLPEPEDKRVSFETIPEQYVGAIEYSWLSTDGRNKSKASELKSWLEKQQEFEIQSGPLEAGYDPPWTIPFFRKNEMQFVLKKK